MPFTKLNIAPPVFAHRGASYYAPENTMAAFAKAYELGIQWLEFDVMLTADQQVVVIHDETLDRTTNGTGEVHQYRYAELQQLDAGSWFGSAFSGQRIPLLKDVIHWMQQHQMKANIELKAQPGQEQLIAKQVLAIIGQTSQNHLISSFSHGILYAVRNLDADCWIGLLMDEWLNDWHVICEELNAVSVHTNHDIINPERVAAIKSTQRPVYCYTVNDRNRAQELFSWGVDAVYSDCPDKIIM